jgi:hypothetical protein
MRFVPVKGSEQQSVLMLQRARSLLVRQRFRNAAESARGVSPRAAPRSGL